jgi:outer membrane receptor for monomeric catechols
MRDRMPASLLRTIAVVALCFSNGAFAVAGGRPRYAPALIQGSAASSRSTDPLKAPQRAPSLKQNAARTPVADRDPYADPAAPYKANRLSSPHAEPILNIPGQTTVLTRQVLDDMNATSLRDALRSTAGVTVGR